ncbi:MULTISPECIES: hypothetical protein [unclassified Bradyrhizobium]|uniref:hypothetical protein n=1 Tax=unclassified Bradyrhizobium TaxID=2631580 RepID=UPI0028EC6BA9|nr:MULTISPECIES: hypothetical protein [unclassified Bradyrhizobium]
MFDPLAMISLHQDPPTGRSDVLRDSTPAERPLLHELHLRGRDLGAGIGRVAVELARRLRWPQSPSRVVTDTPR